MSDDLKPLPDHESSSDEISAEEPSGPQLGESKQVFEGKPYPTSRVVTSKNIDTYSAIGDADQPVLETGPRKTNGKNSAIQLLQLPSEKITVEIHPPPNPKGVLQACSRFLRAFCKDYGPLITGLMSVVVTLIIAHFAQQISQKQTDVAQEQSKAAQEQVNIRFIEEFRKHLGALTLPDDKQNLTEKNLAAISLAQYGERALPALKMSLTVEDDDIRSGAAVVVGQMLSHSDLRGKVLSTLHQYFDENNNSLRVGVLYCYVTMNRSLTDREFDEAKSKITQYIDPSADYSSKSEEQKLLLQAVKFFGNWPRRASKDFLLAVLRNGTCGDEPREGAANYLPAITTTAKDLSDLEREAARQSVLVALYELLPQASERLQGNITDAITKLK